ncbi:MAG: hydantoinase/oxoprolinase family protein [Burkholderiaceae bacterium]
MSSNNLRDNSVRIGVDIGGTFTDLVAQTLDGSLHILKVPSTPDDPGDAVVAGLNQLLDELGATIAQVTEIVHGTTVGSNTILQKTGALTGVLTTRGFRDILEIGRIRTPVMFDLNWSKPEPLSERHYRLEVSERIAADGSVVTPLNESDVRLAGRQFMADGVEAVAICFINSYLNKQHEVATAKILREEFPKLLVTASFEVLPEIKEYERTSTTVVNAYLLKSMRGYLDRLSQRLSDAGLRAPIRVVSSQGAMMSAAAAADKPVFVVGSGPAGGVMGSAKLIDIYGTGDAIAFDLGGTTAKASLIEAGQPTMTTEYEFRDGISTPSRFVKGGGYMLKVPAIDIAEVGAGGGSLAWIDSGGLLRVGPASAGASPGPACYGQGNQQPTVTDANVVLGYLNPATLAGGTLNIQAHLSAQAIQDNIAAPLGLSLIEAAHGIRHIANLEMARAIRTVTVERGRDARDMVLVASGGGGPVHAAEVAGILEIKRIIITPMSGVFCSLGMLSAPAGRSFVRSIVQPLSELSGHYFEPVMAELLSAARAEMSAEGFDDNALDISWSVDARYFGQSTDVSLTYTPGMNADAIESAFTTAYQKLYNHATEEPVELVNLRLKVTADSENLLRFNSISAQERETASGESEIVRDVWFNSKKPAGNVPVSNRASLIPGSQINGPAIVEAYDTTIVIPPAYTALVDTSGSIMIEGTTHQ